MGPRLFSRGNQPVEENGRGFCFSFNGATAIQPWKPIRCYRTLENKGKLQWGHGYSAVETIPASVSPIGHIMLQWGHGYSAVETRLCVRLFGNTSRFNGATAIQPWKHDAQWDIVGLHDALQWGHGYSAVETTPIIESFDSKEQASMGPRLFSRGNRMIVHLSG